MQNASMPYIFDLKGGLDTSLYVLKVDDDKRVVAAVDDDPIFDKVSLTLFRLVGDKDATQAYKEVGERLYKSLDAL